MTDQTRGDHSDVSAKSDVLACNPLATALFGDLSTPPPEIPNLPWQRFMGTGLDRLVMTPDAEVDDAIACGGRCAPYTDVVTHDRIPAREPPTDWAARSENPYVLQKSPRPNLKRWTSPCSPFRAARIL